MNRLMAIGKCIVINLSYSYHKRVSRCCKMTVIWGGFLIRRSSAIRRFFAGFLRCDNRTIRKSFLKKNRSRILRKFRGIFMQISCQFASVFFEKRLHYCTTIALQKSCDKPANRRAVSDEKPTPGSVTMEMVIFDLYRIILWYNF